VTGTPMANQKQGGINWGIVGTGWVCREFVEGLKHVSGARLAGVCSGSFANAKTFAQQTGAKNAYADMSQLVSDASIDVVYIGTPNSLHAEQCCAALNAGKAVLCEKPFALDAAQARRVIEIARSRNLFCMEAMRMRFMPAMDRVRAMISDGAIGELRMLSANFGIAAPYDLQNRFFNPSLGGGAFFDLGVYALSLAHQIFGSPQHIVAAATVGPSGVDEQSAAILSYAGGKLAILSASLKQELPSGAVITGSTGEIRIEPLYRPEWVTLRKFGDSGVPKPAAARDVKDPADSRTKSIPGLRSAIAAGRKLMRPLRPTDNARERFAFESNGFNYEASEVMRCLGADEKESPIMPLAETLKIMESLDVIRSQWSATPEI
jgi:predicted dehydrogenase